MKNVFYFNYKALFNLKVFKCLYFFPTFPHFPDSEELEGEIIYDAMN